MGISEWTGAEVQKVLQGQKQVQIIDVREPDEYNQGHIPGAKLIPLGTLQHRHHEISPYIPAVMVCRSGSRSLMACRILGGLGYKNVVNLKGGMNKWKGTVVH